MGSGRTTGQELRRTMACFVTGVTVVTSDDGEPRGMTVNSLTSVSLDPPQVLVSIATTSTMHRVLREAGGFTVSVLSASLIDAAKWFASSARPRGAAAFEGFSVAPGPNLGHPVFTDCVTWLECRTEQAVDSGDHTLFTARVVDCGFGQGSTPLLFCNGALMPHEPVPVSPPQAGIAG
ncbi:flavin reductase family protein [Myceligenerans indicum]|uniref:Flavin reductase family protein n=1 Tax=Myceligenerans indicum TaxID=2593663 RepID=A0ABS1LM11_9MICO|nr:flavin reductase family protein [Myceligenerans indicum]MBL0887264.1 flavin reductase family protein [Myceligenerans indicum]